MAVQVGEGSVTTLSSLWPLLPGVRMISLSYSRISLADIAQKLQLDSPEDAEFIVAKVGLFQGSQMLLFQAWGGRSLMAKAVACPSYCEARKLPERECVCARMNVGESREDKEMRRDVLRLRRWTFQ